LAIFAGINASKAATTRTIIISIFTPLGLRKVYLNLGCKVDVLKVLEKIIGHKVHIV
jgi:hypothetical protein